MSTRSYFPLVLMTITACYRWVGAALDVRLPSTSPTKACDKPCYNGGSCLNGNCVCPTGWTGLSCESCHGRIRKNSSSNGYISDGPVNYSTASKCTWIIDGGGEGPLTLRLDEFFTECCWDNVYVYDGEGVFENTLAAFSGSISRTELVARSGKAIVHFASDLAFNLPGFNISYAYNTCPYNCSGHGVCKRDGRCKCERSYSGDYCQLQACLEDMVGKKGPCKKSSVCGKNGKCDCNKHTHGDCCQELNVNPVWDTVVVAEAHHFTPRSSHASALVGSRIYTFGGLTLDSQLKQQTFKRENNTVQSATNGVSLLDLGEKSFRELETGNNPPSPRYDHSMVEYNKRLYVFGGVINSNQITNELWSFDLSSVRWTLLSPHNDLDSAMPMAVAGHTAHVIEQEMHVFFGYNTFEGFILHSQVYSFETKKWRRVDVSSPILGRFGHSSVVYKESDDKSSMVLVYGGYNAPQNGYSYSITDELLLYDVKEQSWTTLANGGIPLFRHTAAILDGILLVVGGNSHNESSKVRQNDCYSSRMLAYDTVCKEWIKISVADTKLLERYGHTALASGEHVFIIGGFSGVMRGDVLKFTPALCNSQATNEEECKDTANGVRCVYHNKTCKKAEPNTSYLQPFLSFIKSESPRLQSECIGSRSERARCQDMKECIDCLFHRGCGWCEGSQLCQRSDTSCADGLLTDRDRCSLGGKRKLKHCTWFTVERQRHVSLRAETRHACISLSDEALLIEEHNKAQAERAALIAGSSAAGSVNSREKPPMSLHSTSRLMSPGKAVGNEEVMNQTCPAPCSVNQDCLSCIDGLCMWCPSTKRCVPMDTYMISFPYGQCQSWVTAANTNRACQLDPYECAVQKTCGECQLVGPRCGWCDDGSGTGLGACMAGTLSGPLKNGACQSSNWYFIGEPSCQCNGHSTCTENSTTQRKCRQCSNRTTGQHCEFCENGFYGDPRNGGSCKPCECNGESKMCNSETGDCYCATKGVTGRHCDRCEPKYVGAARNTPPCYYELITDFIFTFKLDGEDVKDKYVNRINFFSTPPKKDTDVQFSVTCDGDSGAKVAINLTTMIDENRENSKQMMAGQACGPNGIKRAYSSSDPGFGFGGDSNTTFFVRVSDFQTPIKIQISFAQSPPINWVLFFVIFAACFIVLLVVAGLLWMIKLRVEWYRNIRRRHDEIEEMASRPFASVQLELNADYANPQATPIAVEPCSNYQAGVYTFVVKLPTGGKPYTPHGASGLAMASTLCQLTHAQLALLQPDAAEQQPKRKSALRRLISPFMRP